MGIETRPTSLPGRWEGTRDVQAAGWVWGHPAAVGGWHWGGGGGPLGKAPESGGRGVLILAAYPVAGGSQLLSPSGCWMRPSPTLAGSCGHLLATKGTAIGVLSEYGWLYPPGRGLTPIPQLPSPNPTPKQVSASHEHPRALSHALFNPPSGHPLSVPAGPGVGVPAPQWLSLLLG